MSDEFYAPNRKPPPARKATPGEHVWSIRQDGKQYDGELRTHREWGVEFQVLCDREWFYGRRWPTRERALAEAEERKAEYLREGGS